MYGISSLCMICLTSSKIRPKRLTLKPYKEYWFVFKDTTISYYKNKEASHAEPIEQLHLRGKETMRSIIVSTIRYKR